MSLYDIATVGANKARLSKRVQEILSKGFMPFLTSLERRKLANLVLDFREKGQRGSPFEFYARTEGKKQIVYMPILSLLFLEDLCTAYAWLWRKEYSFKSIDKYVTMITKGLELPPLIALQIPDDALNDKATDTLSLRFRNSAYAFILAHEMGHHYHQHETGSGLTPKAAQRNEVEADRFALSLLSRDPNIPMGAIIWLQAIAYAQPNRGLYQSDEEWQAYLDEEGMHPLTPDRLRKISNGLFQYQDEFVRREENKVNGLETIRFISDKVKEIALILEDVDIQIEMQKRAAKMDLSTLTPRPEADFF